MKTIILILAPVLATRGMVPGGSVWLRQQTNGTRIDLGFANAAGTLGLSDADLDKVSAARLLIGDANSGAITVQAVISPATYSMLDIQKGFDFAAAGGFASDITSATAFESIQANGPVTIAAEATLTATTAGDSFTLLDNVSTGTTAGNFAGQPEGALVPLGGVIKVLTYLGGMGNDVLLTPLPVTLDGTALDTTGLTWTMGGNANWFGQTGTTHDGVDAAQSGDISNDGESWLETIVTGPGTLTFWWKVSSEDYRDYLRFALDGIEQAGAPGISWEVDWEQKTVPVPAGSHTLRWNYSKDDSVSIGADAGWLDQVVFTPTAAGYTTDPGGKAFYRYRVVKR